MYLRIYDIATSGESLKSRYRSLLQLWDSPPARRMICGDEYIYCFLEGTWRGDGQYMKIREGADGTFPGVATFPGIGGGAYYTIHQLVWSQGSDKKGWKEMYVLSPRDENTLAVRVISSDRVYTLKRR